MSLIMDKNNKQISDIWPREQKTETLSSWSEDPKSGMIKFVWTENEQPSKSASNPPFKFLFGPYLKWSCLIIATNSECKPSSFCFHISPLACTNHDIWGESCAYISAGNKWRNLNYSTTCQKQLNSGGNNFSKEEIYNFTISGNSSSSTNTSPYRLIQSKTSCTISRSSHKIEKTTSVSLLKEKLFKTKCQMNWFYNSTLSSLATMNVIGE